MKRQKAKEKTLTRISRIAQRMKHKDKKLKDSYSLIQSGYLRGNGKFHSHCECIPKRTLMAEVYFWFELMLEIPACAGMTIHSIDSLSIRNRQSEIRNPLILFPLHGLLRSMYMDSSEGHTLLHIR